MPARNRLKLVLCPRITLGVAADEMHRAAEYDLIDDTAEEGFRALLQLPDEGADYIGERDRELSPGACVRPSARCRGCF